MEFGLIAKTFMGLEPVLAKELTQMGANNVKVGRRMVSFTGDKEIMDRANYTQPLGSLGPLLDFRPNQQMTCMPKSKKLIGVCISKREKHFR